MYQAIVVHNPCFCILYWSRDCQPDDWTLSVGLCWTWTIQTEIVSYSCHTIFILYNVYFWCVWIYILYILIWGWVARFVVWGILLIRTWELRDSSILSPYLMMRYSYCQTFKYIAIVYTVKMYFYIYMFILVIFLTL